MTRAMKDSGIDWIGEIPEGWKIQNLKSILRERNELNNPVKTDFVLSLTNDRGVIPYSEKGDIGNKAKEDLTKYKLVYPNDIVVNSMNVIIGSVGLSKYFGVVSPVYYMLYVRKEEDSIYYYNYLFQTKELQIKLKGYGNGIMEHRLRIPMINLNKVHLPYPPQFQQKAIADFLDKKVSEIDNIISKTKKVIEEYKKYKQSLITEVVTKGLDKTSPMKDSGIEWIGEIPEHWEVVRLRELFKFRSGLTITKSDLKDKGIKVINYGEIHSKYKFDLDINRDKLKSVDEEYLNIKKSALVSKGDFVFCDTSEDREGSGNCIVIRENKDELIFAGSHTVIAKLKRKENPIFVRYMLFANSIKEQISSTVVGIKVYSVTQSILKTILGILPPLQEQKAIASYLDQKCCQIDKIINSKQQLLIEMEKYKKSLIYEVVTGKREVE
ncbi:restriction endonuclease subunit S [Anaerosalibacter bizertensis]|uniref:Restriction endonuclease subunit S n=1 Tax=Anaerosalibacter bizertensis TaxID=932217 RepID=A0A9Q4ACV0_9FIRM|nr:restriction endonuclease subunit S [Anaerosalibacter bizertensis]MBV1820160.1 restriction endonuclease subunit S [Bacteroidales bacterium MSK.15.36]MCB5559214.1 restriction endonuclease subunit S [Anaerosalibacter bizertensis]MCG4565377.1 restriction endonuclease subunit S [Anaerosalibacter bizertensis]MCG4582980.1 restriction endonuclease subunit S [Anaerosalibacter bizertensis]